MRAFEGDGNDVANVYQMADSAIRELRAGSGPVFLEFATYRWREHCGPNFDNDLGYRSEDEFEAWKTRDPVLLAQRRLGIDGEQVRAWQAEDQEMLDSAFDRAKADPFPEPQELFTQVYADSQ
jgi:pyruvate dehydrogenase E1 component alpha subunit